MLVHGACAESSSWDDVIGPLRAEAHRVIAWADPLEPGTSAADASSLVPGGTLGETLELIPLSGGATDTVIAPESRHGRFCADLPEEQAPPWR